MKRLKEALLKSERAKHPGYPEHLTMPIKAYKITTANGLTNAIKDFIKAHGFQAERVNTMGIPKDNRKIITDVMGFQRMIGSIDYRPSGSTTGSADIHASIPIKGSNGFAVSVKIEIKIGRDKQSEAQLKYADQVRAAGGIYIVVHNLEEFFNWWDNFVDF